MKTNFNDFLNEYKESFDSIAILKDIIATAAPENTSYDSDKMIDEIYKLIQDGSIPTAVDNIIKKYPYLTDFKQELIVALDEE